jgi:hypothetical membrane protein
MSDRPNGASSAFPNAYFDTDVPPRRLSQERIIASISVLGTSFFGLTILALTLFDPDYNSISQAASDYGVGRFALEMNLGFFVGGIGLIAFAWLIGRKDAVTKSRAGSALFLIAGFVLMMNSYFTTNVEGGPSSLHGTIHGLGGFVFFVTAPVGTILVSRKFGRGRIVANIIGLIVGFSLLAVNAGLSGLAERAILLVIFSVVILDSISQAKG